MQVPQLNDKDLKELQSKPLIAKLGTLSSKGDIRVSPVWFGVDDGSFLISTFEESGLVRNLRRNPRCSLLIDSTDWPYIGVHYWGTATVEGPENDADAIGRLFAPYFKGELQPATEYGRQLIGWGKRVFVRFRPQRKTTWDFRH